MITDKTALKYAKALKEYYEDIETKCNILEGKCIECKHIGKYCGENGTYISTMNSIITDLEDK